MQVKTIREASKPVYIFSRFAGTVAIKRTTPEELTKSYPQSLLSIIYFAIFTIPAFVYYEDAFNFIKEADVSTTIFITSQVFLVTNFTSIITSAFLIHFYSKTIIAGVETLLDVDKNFDKINSQETLLRTNYSIWKRSIIALMGCLFCSLLPNVMALRINNSSAIITLNFSAAILINSSIKLQYYFASQILYFRFKTLSGLLSALVERSKRCPSYPTSEKSFEKALSKIGKIHKDLVGLAKSVNLIYSVPLLFYVVLYLFSGLNSGYFVVYNFVTGNPLGPFVFLLYVNVSILLTYNLVEFFVLIRSTTSMCCEVSQNVRCKSFSVLN